MQESCVLAGPVDFDLEAGMTPRVLLVDDEPDVIAAVKTHLDGFEVHTAGTLEKAREELQSGDFQLILCDPAVTDPAALVDDGRSHGGYTRLIIDRGPEAVRETRDPLFYEPGGPAIDLTQLKSLLEKVDPPGASHSPADALRRRLFALLGDRPAPGRCMFVLDAFRDVLGAEYVACLQREGDGARVLYETCGPSGRRLYPPVDFLTSWDAAGVRTAMRESTLWTAVAPGADVAFVAAFQNAEVDRVGAFAECASPAAAFLARCVQATPVAESATVLMNAVSSLVHDTRNLVTGLTLYLGAYRENRRLARQVVADELAILDKQVLSLAVLCREYTRIDVAARLDAATARADVSVSAFAGLLAKFGIEVDSVEIDPSFRLPAAAHGVMSRALVHISLGLLELRARRVRITAAAAGAQSLDIAFASRLPSKAQVANQSMAQACDLVNSRGGRADLQTRRGRTRVTVEFAAVPRSEPVEKVQ